MFIRSRNVKAFFENWRVAGGLFIKKNGDVCACDLCVRLMELFICLH